jgi:hypothetical protein
LLSALPTSRQPLYTPEKAHQQDRRALLTR